MVSLDVDRSTPPCDSTVTQHHSKNKKLFLDGPDSDEDFQDKNKIFNVPVSTDDNLLTTSWNCILNNELTTGFFLKILLLKVSL